VLDCSGHDASSLSYWSTLVLERVVVLRRESVKYGEMGVCGRVISVGWLTDVSWCCLYERGSVGNNIPG